MQIFQRKTTKFENNRFPFLNVFFVFDGFFK